MVLASLGDMRIHDLLIALDEQPAGPLYLQVAGALAGAIRQGRIAAGATLPGIRELADRLGMHRNTILAALHELEAQGYLVAKPRIGFFVTTEQPSEESPISAPEVNTSSVGFDLPSPLPPVTDAKGLVIDLSDGVADTRLAPTEALARAYQRALRLKGIQLLGGSDFKGVLRLRQALAARLLTQRAIAIDPDQLLVMRSTSMAVTLVAQSLLGSDGAEVAVEDPGMPIIWDALRHAGATRLHGVPVDQEGMCVDALEDLLKTTQLRLLVLTPQCHYPTGVPLSPARRKQVLSLAQQYRIPILELDPEYDFKRGTPIPPLASQDTTGQVLYVGSLSRVFGPGLRLSFLVVPPPLADGLAKARQRLDWQGEPVLEWAIAELIMDGDMERHIRRMRRAATERLEALEDALNHTLKDHLRFTTRHSAMGLWVEGIGKMADAARFNAWVRMCNLRGIKIRIGNYFVLHDRPLAATRIGFTAYQPEELQRAVAHMV